MSSCDLGSIIQNHFNMLIDIFKQDLRKLGVESVYTKCLYTAVTILYLICGQNAIQGSLQCYVDRVKSRMSKKTDDEKRSFIKDNVQKAMDDVLKNSNRRMVYFIMITNSELPHPSNSKKENAFFPGHVFVIDKQIKKGEKMPFYRLYQSYINKYTLQDYSQTIDQESGTLYHEYTYERMKKLFEDLRYFINSSIWDDKNVAFWREFTLVDARNFRGYPVQPYIHFCYNVLPAINCKRGLYELLEQKRANGQIPSIYKTRVDQLLKNRYSNTNNSNDTNSARTKAHVANILYQT